MAASAVPGHLAGVLLLLASLLLGAGQVSGAPRVLETLGLAVVGSSVAALADLHLRPRRFGFALLALALFAIGDRLAEHAEPLGRAWALPAAFGGYLLWRAIDGSWRAVAIALGPVAVAVAGPLAVRSAGIEIATMTLLVLPFALAAAALAEVRRRRTTEHAALQQNQLDLDAVVMTNVELRHVEDAKDAANRIARMAAELMQADGAVVWLQGPGQLLSAGGFGTPPPAGRTAATGAAVERVFLTSSVVTDGDEVVLPLSGAGGVFGAVAVHHPRRAAESFLGSVLQVFGAQAGYALARLRAVESLIDARFVDPVTGVGNRLAASASLATLHPGDAVLLLAVDSLATLRAAEGDARADLTLGQLGLHLRTATRAGDVVARYADDVFFVLLRDLATTAEPVVRRILDSWEETSPYGHLRAGAALHEIVRTPLDTLDRATEALAVAVGRTTSARAW